LLVGGRTLDTLLLGVKSCESSERRRGSIQRKKKRLTDLKRGQTLSLGQKRGGVIFWGRNIRRHHDSGKEKGSGHKVLSEQA